MKNISEMSTEEKKKLRTTLIIILGIIILTFGFYRIQKKVISIIENNSFEGMFTELEIPEMNIPQYPEEIKSEETLEENLSELIEDLLLFYLRYPDKHRHW